MKIYYENTPESFFNAVVTKRRNGGTCFLTRREVFEEPDLFNWQGVGEERSAKAGIQVGKLRGNEGMDDFLVDLFFALHHKSPQKIAILEKAVLQGIEKGWRFVTQKRADEGVRFMRLAWDVRREIHHAKAYIRLTPMEDHGEVYSNTPLLWGEFVLEHETAPLVLQHFMKRFPEYVILLLVKDKAYAAKNGEIHETVVDRNAFALPVQRDEFLEEWLAFYQSQYIPERRNIKLMKRHIPKKYWGFMPETVLASDLRRASC